jgi:hypothetical protein
MRSGRVGVSNPPVSGDIPARRPSPGMGGSQRLEFGAASNENWREFTFDHCPSKAFSPLK